MNTQYETPYQTPAANSSIPSAGNNKKRLKSVSPVRAGLVLGVLYAVMVFLAMLIIIPLGLTGMFSGGRGLGVTGAREVGVGLGMIIGGPLIYGLVGFIGGVIAAWIYNIIAKMTGGLEFTLEDAP